MSHRKQGYRFNNDWTLEEMREDTEKAIRVAITVPVNVEIEGSHRLVHYNSVKQILLGASKLSLMDCSCRRKRGHCDSPIQTCIGLGAKAEQALSSPDFKHLNPREVSFEEAVQVLEKSHEAGLVHMAYIRDKKTRTEDIDFLCSCCSCCCSVLGGVLRYGLAPHLLTSEKISVTDSSKCINCGLCVDRCQFGARKFVKGKVTFKPELCFGCGLCASKCPKGIIKIVDKK